MKKLLFQLDTDQYPAVFDTVVAYDGGADHVTGFANVTPEKIGALVDGAIFTRAPKEKKYTAIFIGGSNVNAGQQLLAAIRQHFFAGFQVSVMLDSNGCNTTAAAGVARLMQGRGLTGKKAVILGGTGPVGQRAAAMLALEGAKVSLTSRNLEGASAACDHIRARFGVSITPKAAPDCDTRGAAIADAQIVFATGAAGVELLKPEHWLDNPNLEVLADANATPPLGIGGIEMGDKGVVRHGKVVWGAIGFGSLKLALHRACIARLFTDNTLILDAEAIFALAKQMAISN